MSLNLIHSDLGKGMKGIKRAVKPLVEKTSVRKEKGRPSRLDGGLLSGKGYDAQMICLSGHSGMSARANKYIQVEWICQKYQEEQESGKTKR